MAQLKLLSTDFDGTLISHASDGRCSPAFAEVLHAHKASGGFWAVNTGRGLDHAIEGIEQFSAPIQPDFLLTNEREVFQRGENGSWIAHHEWNELCYRRHDELFQRASGIIRRIRALAARSQEMTIIEECGKPIGVLTSNESAMEILADFLDNEMCDFPDFSYQRNTIYLRFCHRDYHKGSSLGELCNLLEIDRSSVLAAGDHFNDIPMLDGRFAAFPCCPSNAIPEVQDTVRAAGGHLASKSAADGVAEAWHFFRSLF